MEGEGWVGVLAPMGTPKEIVALLNKQINEIIATAGVEREIRAARPRHRRRHAGGRSPSIMRAEGEKWAKVIKAAGIKAK